MKLKIISEGVEGSTKVVNEETGEEVENILNVEVSMSPFNIEAAILIRDPHISISNLDTEEFKESDSTRHDGGTSDPDDQQHSEQAGLKV